MLFKYVHLSNLYCIGYYIIPQIFSSLIKLVDWTEGNYSIKDKPYPRGEVHVGGNTVGHGYYKMPEKTKEDFYIDENGIRWFKTGDIGMIDETGNLTLIGKS